jgi:hypothetical protein
MPAQAIRDNTSLLGDGLRSMSVWTAVGGLLTLLPAMLKKKRFVLHYQGLDAVWRKKSNPMSKRQCRKTRSALVALGPYLFARFAILREGVDP